MRIDLKQLKKLPVETRAGKRLGHVSDVVIDIDGQLIAQYYVRSAALIGGDSYVISRDQVIRIDEEKMVVADSVVPVTSSKETAMPLEASAPMAPQI